MEITQLTYFKTVAKYESFTKAAMELHIPASILAASTKNIGGRVFGNMLLSVPDEGDTVEKTLAYLQGVPDMVAEEVEEHVS